MTHLESNEILLKVYGVKDQAPARKTPFLPPKAHELMEAALRARKKEKIVQRYKDAQKMAMV